MDVIVTVQATKQYEQIPELTLYIYSSYSLQDVSIVEPTIPYSICIRSWRVNSGGARREERPGCKEGGEFMDAAVAAARSPHWRARLRQLQT